MASSGRSTIHKIFCFAARPSPPLNLRATTATVADCASHSAASTSSRSTLAHRLIHTATGSLSLSTASIARGKATRHLRILGSAGLSPYSTGESNLTTARLQSRTDVLSQSLYTTGDKHEYGGRSASCSSARCLLPSAPTWPSTTPPRSSILS
jgi:hypothetical protein